MDGNDRLWFFDKGRRKKGIQRTTPGNLFVEGHLYSTIEADGSRDARIESFLSKWETKAWPVLRKIIEAARCGREPELTASERRILNVFVMYQLKRTPDFFRSLNFDTRALVEKSIRKYERRFGAVPGEEKGAVLSDAFLRRAEQNARVQGVARVSDRTLEALGGKGLQIVHIRRPGKSFVLGSLPLARYSAEGESHLSHPAVELWLPIAWDVAITPYGPAQTEGFRTLDDERLIRQMNRTIFTQSTVVASHSRDLLSSLAGL